MQRDELTLEPPPRGEVVQWCRRMDGERIGDVILLVSVGVVSGCKYRRVDHRNEGLLMLRRH